MNLGDGLNKTKKNTQELREEFEATRDILREISKAMGRTRDATKEAATEYRKLESLAQNLLLDQDEIVQLTDKQIQQYRDKAAASVAEIKNQAEALMREKGIVDIKNEQINQIQGLSAAQKELLSAAKDGYEVENKLIEDIEKELQTRERINKSLGLTGGFIKGINEVAGQFSKVLNLDKVQKDMEKFSKKYEGNVSRVRVLGVGIASAYKNAAETLTDPAFLLGNLIKGFKAVEKEQVEFARLTGEQVSHVDTLNLKYLTSADYIKAATELTKEFGLNAAAVFTPEDITEVASMTEQMGLAGKEAANLARLSKINGGNIEDQNEAIIDGINSANAQNKTAVAHGAALRDVANASEGIAISYAGYPEKLGAAATAAAGLGMNLAQVDKIAS